MLLDYFKIEQINAYKPFFYLSLYQNIESSNTQITALLNKVTHTLTVTDNELIFVSNKLSKLYLDNPKLCEKLLDNKDLIDLINDVLD